MSRAGVTNDFWERAHAVDKALKSKRCLAENSTECDGPIIAAHTIPRSQLDRIASSGHVKTFSYNADALARNGGKIEIANRGIRQFSVLNCFCQKHDQELFSAVENESLTFSQKQLLLLHYRALGAELYKKQGLIESLQSHQVHFEKRRGADNKSRAKALKGLIEWHGVGLRDAELSFSSAGNSLTNEQFDDVSALVVTFARPPNNDDGRRVRTSL